MNIFKNDILPRKLTLEQQTELAKEYAKPQFIDALIKEEVYFKDRYKQAMFIDAKNEAEDYRVMLCIVNMALRYSLN